MPVDRKIASQEIYGIRENKQTGTSEVVICRRIEVRNWYLLHPDGPGVALTSYPQYCLKAGHEITELNHLEAELEFSGPKDSRYKSAINKPILPITNSRQWIATQTYDMQGDCVSVNLLVFDKGKVVRKVKVPNCSRCSSFTNGLEYKDGNTKVIFHTMEGQYTFDIAKDTFVKIRRSD